MKPKLPRQLLWTEVRTIDEFINDDIINHVLYRIVNDLPQKLFPKRNDVVKLFNEMYYMMTRFYYEEPKIVEYREYQSNIKTDLRWEGCPDLVFFMMYTYFRLRKLQYKPAVEDFVKFIESDFGWSAYWPYFKNITSSVYRFPPSKFDPQIPHPIPAKELMGVKLDFETITCGHNFEAIQGIVNLWTDEISRKIIARILLEDVSKYSSSFITNLDDIINWLDSIIDDDNKKQVIELQKRIESLTAEIEELRQNKAPNSQAKQFCFTNRQMGILMTAVGKLTEKDNPPRKTTIGDVVEKIAGYSATTVNQNMKGTIPKKDIETIVSVLESKFPNLAAEIRKS